MKKLVDALLQTSDYSQREKIYYELKQELQVFLDLVRQLDSLDLSSELHPVIASAVREIESLIQDCEDAFRTLKARGEELKQTKAKLDEECQVIMKDSADYAEKWETLHQKLHEISLIDLPQSEDVHLIPPKASEVIPSDYQRTQTDGGKSRASWKLCSRMA